MTFFEFTKKFPNENSAIDFIIATKYKNGYYCPICGCFHKGIHHQKYNHRFLHCNNCRSEFSGLKNTIFENTHLDLRILTYVSYQEKVSLPYNSKESWVWVQHTMNGLLVMKTKKVGVFCSNFLCLQII